MIFHSLMIIEASQYFFTHSFTYLRLNEIKMKMKKLKKNIDEIINGILCEKRSYRSVDGWVTEIIGINIFSEIFLHVLRIVVGFVVIMRFARNH